MNLCYRSMFTHTSAKCGVVICQPSQNASEKICSYVNTYKDSGMIRFKILINTVLCVEAIVSCVCDNSVKGCFDACCSRYYCQYPVAKGKQGWQQAHRLPCLLSHFHLVYSPLVPTKSQFNLRMLWAIAMAPSLLILFFSMLTAISTYRKFCDEVKMTGDGYGPFLTDFAFA